MITQAFVRSMDFCSQEENIERGICRYEYFRVLRYRARSNVKSLGGDIQLKGKTEDKCRQWKTKMLEVKTKRLVCAA